MASPGTHGREELLCRHSAEESPVCSQTPALYLLLHYLLLAIDGSKRLEASRCVGLLQLGAAGTEVQAREIPPSLCCKGMVPSPKGERSRSPAGSHPGISSRETLTLPTPFSSKSTIIPALQKRKKSQLWRLHKGSWCFTSVPPFSYYLS